MKKKKEYAHLYDGDAKTRTPVDIKFWSTGKALVTEGAVLPDQMLLYKVGKLIDAVTVGDDKKDVILHVSTNLADSSLWINLRECKPSCSIAKLFRYNSSLVSVSDIEKTGHYTVTVVTVPAEPKVVTQNQLKGKHQSLTINQNALRPLYQFRANPVSLFEIRKFPVSTPISSIFFQPKTSGDSAHLEIKENYFPDGTKVVNDLDRLLHRLNDLGRSSDSDTSSPSQKGRPGWTFSSSK
jgi:hypothetical protein